MLKLIIPSFESFDEEKNEFIYSKGTTIQLEHSLISLSKWESKWEKPFLSVERKSIEESIDYIRCMTLTQNVNSIVYSGITNENISEVGLYIDAPMTATTINKFDRKSNREIITAEIIYYWMITLNVPFECQKWHLNRLLTLINVCNIKNQPPMKMGRAEILSRNASLNSARKQALGTRG